MQTFLPYQNFEWCARVLDYRRLGNQRNEALQIYNTIKYGGGWSQHPAVAMWRGWESSLAAYHNVMIDEWVALGYKNTMRKLRGAKMITPPWVTRRLCISHRSNLLRKQPEWYAQFGWNVPADLPYLWPSQGVKR